MQTLVWIVVGGSWLSSLAALVVSIRALVDTALDVEALRARGIGNGRRKAASGAERSAWLRMSLAAVLLTTNSMVLFVIVTASRVRWSVMVVLLLLLAASTLVWADAALLHTVRRQVRKIVETEHQTERRNR